MKEIILQIKTNFIVIFALIILVFYSTQEAFACQPLPYPEPVLIPLIDSDIAFIGTVTSKEHATYSHKFSEFSEAEIPIKILTFDIHSKWKGNLNNTITPRFTDFFCGDYHFANNNVYLVVVNNAENNYPYLNLLYFNLILTDNSELNFINPIH